MLPEALQSQTVPAAIEAWDPGAICGGSCDLGETLLWVDPGKIASICEFLNKQQAFERLSGITAIDRYPMEPRFEVLYLLHSIARNTRLKLKSALPGTDPCISSVTSIYAGANWYERETFDLFGIRFTGHPDLKRIMMPDEWEGHPLRRDFPVDGHRYGYQNE